MELEAQRVECVFFFFKQKTAYEILACLEFRRVLSRSAAALPPPPLRRLGPRRRRPSPEPFPVVACSGCPTGAPPRARLASRGCGGLLRVRRRSEARRVGKGCRYRWSPVYSKKRSYVSC